MRKTCFFLVLSIVLFSAVRVKPQQVFKVAVKQVYLPVRVFKNDQPLMLAKENFRVWEKAVWDQNSDEAEQTIEDFARYDSGELPVALAAAIDSSGSMAAVFSANGIVSGNRLELARNACKELFRSIFREGKDYGLVSEFFLDLWGYKVVDGVHYLIVRSLFLDQDWTDNLTGIYGGLSKVGPPGGATPMRDAIYELASHFEKMQGEYLRVLVVLSDGLDNPPTKPGGTVINTKSLTAVVEELQNQQVLVFSIGLYPKAIFGGQEPEVLETIAKETGGEVFFETNLAKLPDIFLEIGDKIRNVNFLSYTPKAETEGPRQIRVEVGKWENGKWKKEKGCRLYYRQGYNYKN